MPSQTVPYPGTRSNKETTPTQNWARQANGNRLHPHNKVIGVDKQTPNGSTIWRWVTMAGTFQHTNGISVKPTGVTTTQAALAQIALSFNTSVKSPRDGPCASSFGTLHVPRAALKDRVEQHVTKASLKSLANPVPESCLQKEAVPRRGANAGSSHCKGQPRQCITNYLVKIPLQPNHLYLTSKHQPLTHHQLSEKTFSAGFWQLHCR